MPLTEDERVDALTAWLLGLPDGVLDFTHMTIGYNAIWGDAESKAEVQD